ncbi:DUF3100 domain-containing protein [Paenarthrobacter sp. PH39-S1]|uniref:DUF3100 domain-containing protein n=1 Tax=Paenarthrobacter sp. PH39-S1 TaxID=3046204 RepID=UPI0024B9876F|nr:DUF3100 domain-containing protein [Paenarthrobacter sp. PH39-S1]MDJ0357864.1 DUF3100 domain-containing protein [Paenarthrobacter sp. PH39-S1]
MMLGGAGALSLLYPSQAPEIMALAALSNLVTNIVGFYAGVFLSLPLCRRLYTFWSRLFGRDDDGRRVGRATQAAAGPADPAAQPAPDAPVAAEDPKVPLSRRTQLLAYGVVGVSGLLMNLLGTKAFVPGDLLGMVILLLLTALSFRLAKWLPTVPSSVWVLGIATVLSAPFLPTSQLFATLTGNLDVILMGVPTLALIGLTVGRDIPALKALSWKVVIVALITYSASFIAAAALGQTVLHL